MYIYTNIDCTQILSINTFIPENNKGLTLGEIALLKRKELEKKLKQKVVAWCLMGADNNAPEKILINIK
jgi:hypothetical protein